MAQFQVPQFIETEDKIVGPLTLKQFFYVAGAGALSFMLFFRLELFLWFFISTIIIAIGVALAFVQVNGRPLSVFLTASVSYLWQPKVYTFKPRVLAPQSSAIPGMDSTRLITSGGRATSQVHGLKSLLRDLITSKTAIPKRERPLTESFGIISKKDVGEHYEVIRSITGGREKAKRIDYR